MHVRRQAVVGAVEQLGDGRTQKRVGYPPILGIAPLDSRDSRGMVFVLGRHAANQRQLVGDRCGVGDQFAEMDSGELRRDRSERSAELGAGFWVPGLELADASVEPDEQHLFLLLLLKVLDIKLLSLLVELQ